MQNRALLYSELSEWDKAIEDYSSILLIKEDDEESLYRRGLIKIEKNDTLGARIDFERIVKNNPISSKGRLGLATIMKIKKSYSNALDMYTQVIKVNSENPDLYLKRSEVYYLDGKLAKAAEDINKSISIKSDDPLAYIIRGRIRYAQLDNKSAIEDFEKALSLGGESELIDPWIKKCK